eukprot:146472_1
MFVVLWMMHIIYCVESVEYCAGTRHEKDTNNLTREEYNEMSFFEIEQFVMNQSYFKCEIETFKQKLIEIGIEGSNIFDAASGVGRWSRISVELGANKVVGVDTSPQQIERAARFKHNKSNILEYYVHDMNQPLPKQFQNQFDIVINSHLFCYASNENMIHNFCKNMRAAFNNHSKSGKKQYIIGIIDNFEQSPFSYPLHLKYGWIKQISAADFYFYIKYGYLRNGTKIQMEGFEPVYYKMTMWIYSREVYEKYLIQAGFKNIEWFEFNCDNTQFYDDENVRQFVHDYYQDQTNIGFVAQVNNDSV